jgi:hypothetical protein
MLSTRTVRPSRSSPAAHESPAQSRADKAGVRVGLPRFLSSRGRTAHHEATRILFPHGREIDRSLGTAASTRTAVVDRAECERCGVEAFTDGGVAHFRSESPALDVAAHEAAHLMQHDGRTGDMGLGAEGHAQAVSRSVQDGRPARHLIGAGGTSVSPSVRPYTEVPASAQSAAEWSAGGALRVADNGLLATRESGSHDAWAHSALITVANLILTLSNSVIRLSQGAGMLSGTSPDGSGRRTLHQVVPESTATSTSGDALEIWADCGRSARDVIGVGAGTGKNYSDITAVANEPYVPSWWERIFNPVTGSTSPATVEYETSEDSPGPMKEEIFKRLLGGTAAEAWAKYQAMTPAERDRFDQAAGINEYAQPGVGEGYTMSTGGTPYPGESTWNFHWAGVVLESGADRITLENYAVGDPEAKNTDWEFAMYGPASKPGQTFHEQHEATRQHGDAPTTLRVRPR